MRKLSAVTMFIGLTAMMDAPAQDLHVPSEYSSIQAAVDAAPAGSRIVVGPGHYFENLLIEKSVTLISSAGPEATVIDGRHLDPVIIARGTGSEAVEISGFTIINGFNEMQHVGPAQARAAGVFVESVEATIRDNVVRDNVGCLGTGIGTLEAQVIIEHNVVADNPQSPGICSAAIGGGIFALGGSGVIANNEISGHVIGGGGAGVAVQGGDIAILDNLIYDNHTTFAGGGIRHIMGSGVVRGNRLLNNTAESGGALSVVSDIKMHISGNVMIGNDATMRGSSVELVPFGNAVTQFVHNTIHGNSAVELIVCQMPYRINRSNELVNESGLVDVGCVR